MTINARIELPDPLPYPNIGTFATVPELKDKFCYILDDYPLVGVELIVVRQSGHVCVRLADFSGKLLAIESGVYPGIANIIMREYSQRLLATLRLTGIPKAIFYFSCDNNQPRLVDLRFSINKFASPGYLYDFFGKQGLPIQSRVGDPTILDQVKIDSLLATGKKYMIKTSAFKTIMRGDDIVPLYGTLGNEAKPIVRDIYGSDKKQLSKV